MKASTLLILGAAGAGAFFLLRKPAAGAPSSGMPQSPQRMTSASVATVMKPSGYAGNSNVGKAPAPQTGAPSGRDLTVGLAAAGAGAACATLIPGVGAAAAPLCGSAGAYLGDKAYTYGQKAWDEVSSWF